MQLKLIVWLGFFKDGRLNSVFSQFLQKSLLSDFLVGLLSHDDAFLNFPSFVHRNDLRKKLRKHLVFGPQNSKLPIFFDRVLRCHEAHSDSGPTNGNSGSGSPSCLARM